MVAEFQIFKVALNAVVSLEFTYSEGRYEWILRDPETYKIVYKKLRVPSSGEKGYNFSHILKRV